MNIYHVIVSNGSWKEHYIIQATNIDSAVSFAIDASDITTDAGIEAFLITDGVYFVVASF